MQTPESHGISTPLRKLEQGACPTNADLIACKMTPDMLTEEVRAAIKQHIPTCLDCTRTSLTIDEWTPEQKAKTIRRAESTPLKDLRALVRRAIYEEGDMTTVKAVTERCVKRFKDKTRPIRYPDAYIKIIKFIVENTFLRDKMN